VKTKNVPAKRGRPAKKPETEVVKKAAAAVQAVEAVDAMTLLSRAVDANLPLETMERLLTMRREMKAEWAQEQFLAALTGFQHDCPVIAKEKRVKNKKKQDEAEATVRYAYAPMEEGSKESMEKWGFSYTFDNDQAPGSYTAICEAHHKDGHTRKTKFTVPIDAEAFMSAPQKIGAACTFADRYAFKNAFGIVTKGEDTDAVAPEEERKPLQAPQAKPQQAKSSAPIPAAFVEVKPGSKAEFDQLLGTMEKAPGIDKLVVLFTENEKIDWRHMANEAHGKPEELARVFADIRKIVDSRRIAIKGEKA